MTMFSADTDPKVIEHYRRQIMQKTGAERLHMACSMFSTAKSLVEANLRRRNPEITPDRLRIEVFKRIYAEDFTPKELEKIAARLEQRQSTPSPTDNSL